ncbi:MAG TPA: glycoside hydrolase family 15 protein [Polyangiaceae bacterium]
MDEPPIYDYALIGDGRSAALVSRGGSIDWLCWPRFDSPSLFAAILDAKAGGHFRIAPEGAARGTREYVEESNVLSTTFEAATGSVRVLDFMSVFSEEHKQRALVPEHELVRIVEGVSGEVEVAVSFEPRPDYARRDARLRRAGPLGIRIEQGAEIVTLRADVPLSLDGASAVTARFLLRAGERRTFSLTYDAHGPAVLPPLGDYSLAALEHALTFWTAFARRASYDGPYRAAVIRSLLAVKLLSFAPSGAVVAAPTTSLPERVGGDLNWDYRFCWLRDAAFTARALHGLGYEDEANAFVNWLLHATRLTRPELRVLYDVYGELPAKEQDLEHLSGYRGSKPVRIQNAATEQVQLDTYGEVIDAVARLCGSGARLDRETQDMLRSFGRYVCGHWHLPDHGIWEGRGQKQHHTHSRVLCWTALDRLLGLCRRGVLERVPVDEFAAHRDAIRRDIEERAWNPRHATYTQVLGGDGVDASLLLLPWYGFSQANAPRLLATFDRIEERLGAGDGLVYRYERSRADREGAFGICGFWAAEFLARGGGSLERAEQRFEKLLTHASDVGLFAEEVSPKLHDGIGNFPQAYTHVGVISAALAIEERRGRAPT